MTDDGIEGRLADMQKQINALRAARVGYTTATVTAVDVAGSTFSVLVAQEDGSTVDLDGVVSPPHFLPAVGDTVLLALSGAKPLYQPARVSYSTIGPDGAPTQVLALGQNHGGIDSATGLQTWAIDEKGAGSLQDLSVTDDPIFQGTPLSEMLAPLAQFHAGASRGADNDPATTPAGGGETGFYEMTVEFYPDHIYLIQTSNLWVRPLTGTSRIDLNLRRELSTDPDVDPPAVTIASQLFARSVREEAGSSNNIGGPAMISRLYRVSQYVHYRFLLSLSSVGGQAFIELGSADITDPVLGTPIEPDSVQLFVIDLGVSPWTNRAVLNSGGGGGTTPAPVKRWTHDYFAHWSRRFRGDGSVFGDNGDCYQGQTPYYPANGDQATQIGGFTRTGGNSLHADLAGATVESLYVYLYANHWNSYDGGTAVIRYHNNANPGSLNNFAGGISVGGWARGQGRWVDITSWASLFQGTAAQGIQVGKANSTDPTFYGIFDGPAGGQPPRLRCTYTK